MRCRVSSYLPNGHGQTPAITALLTLHVGVIEVVRSQANQGPDSMASTQGSSIPKFTPNKDRTTMAPEKRSRYVQEMDSEGLSELLSRMTLSNYHMEAVRKEAMSQLVKKAFEQKAKEEKK
jgi:hypothetical protein